jgi:hypothetical protein
VPFIVLREGELVRFGVAMDDRFVFAGQPRSLVDANGSWGVHMVTFHGDFW